MRHFLVTQRDGKLESVRAFDDTDEAMRAYEEKERELGWRVRDFDRGGWKALNPGATCVLLGADRLSTCIATHGNWFDEPADYALWFAALTLASVPEAEIRERLGLSAEEFEKANARLRRALGRNPSRL